MDSGYSPGLKLEEPLQRKIERNIIRRWQKGCHTEGIVYRGILYPGLIITAEGPKVLEFNARLGDPETQILLLCFRGDLANLLYASATDSLDESFLSWSAEPSVCVAMCSRGYPGTPDIGKEISGLEEAAEVPMAKIFHAGTKKENGKWITTGGRVLGVTAVGEKARERAHEAVS